MQARPVSGSWPRREHKAAPEKFEVKRFGALEHSNDNMAVISGGYSALNFTGSV
jgi:hypothetical protein